MKSNGFDSNDAPGLVIIAGDISPMGVIMHFPILCEDHGVPYIFVRSRAELGVAACTKRATSVVMLKPEGKKPGKKDGDDAQAEEGADKKGADEKGADDDGTAVDPAEYLQALKELVKLALKEWQVQVEPWVKGTHRMQLNAGSIIGGPSA
jgi:H/ACA ribonucleoprotein complex subunit 2